MFEVIMPVYNEIQLTDDIFQNIYDNSMKPKTIFLIDNSDQDNYLPLVDKYQNKLNIKYLKQKENIGVNASWNLGFSLVTSPYISVLNNDLILNKYFFEMIFDSFQSDDKIGILVPNTIDSKKLKITKENPIINDLAKREGWAYTIRRSCLYQLVPIPKEFRTFFGDDYLFQGCLKRGYRVCKIMNNPIYHYGSVTVKKLNLDKTELKKEKVIWKNKNNAKV